jgi:hypothetical protein
VGIGLAAASLALMPALGIAKRRTGERIGSPATAGEGAQNLLCASMAVALLAGLSGNALAGLWWLDPAAALVIAALAVNEGVETWRGEGCCHCHRLRGRLLRGMSDGATLLANLAARGANCAPVAEALRGRSGLDHDAVAFRFFAEPPPGARPLQSYELPFWDGPAEGLA